MNAPIWIIVFHRSDDKQWLILRCASANEAEKVIYHNTYYGHRCLKITVKAWR